MPHVMKLHDSVTGRHYELTLQEIDGAWRATWLMRNGQGQVVTGAATGSITRSDAEDAFRAAKRQIEDGDDNVIGNDWDFLPPVPPWLDG